MIRVPVFLLFEFKCLVSIKYSESNSIGTDVEEKRVPVSARKCVISVCLLKTTNFNFLIQTYYHYQGTFDPFSYAL